MNWLSVLAPYKTYLALTVLAVALATTGWAGWKVGSMRVQAKWDQETIGEKTREVELATRVISLQEQIADRDRRQAEIDAAAAARHAAERERLETQAREIRSSLDRLTRDVNNPQYQACVLDPATLAELNRSLRK